MPEVRIPESRAEVREFEHPDGSTGIMAGTRLSGDELADRFDLDGDYGDAPVVLPFRHNTDGRTDFEEYRHEDGDIVFEMTDEQFSELRDFIRATL